VDRSGSIIPLLITVDTEEDNWTPAVEGVTVENIREIPKFQAFVNGLGLTPTYFTSYQVSSVPWAAELLRDAARGRAAEIAAHLHAWNTPPHHRDPFGSNTMVKNLPSTVQHTKLAQLTRTHKAVFGSDPISFRAGRYGIGPDLVRSLIDLGYKVDSSVTPFWDWRGTDNGPDHRRAPIKPYRLGAGGGSVLQPVPGGPIVELPLSCGYNRRPLALASRADRLFRSWPMRSLKAPGIAWRTRLLRRVILSPEVHEATDMLNVARRLVDQGAGYLQLTLHSSSLRPGLSPFAHSWADVDALYAKISTFVECISSFITLAPVTSAYFADSVTQ
jgi:hypothetical protein